MPKSEYFYVFSPFRSWWAPAHLHPRQQKSNKNLSLLGRRFYTDGFLVSQGKNAGNPDGFPSILTQDERKSVCIKHSSDNSRHPKPNPQEKRVRAIINYSVATYSFSLFSCLFLYCVGVILLYEVKTLMKVLSSGSPTCSRTSEKFLPSSIKEQARSIL